LHVTGQDIYGNNRESVDVYRGTKRSNESVSVTLRKGKHRTTPMEYRHMVRCEPVAASLEENVGLNQLWIKYGVRRYEASHKVVVHRKPNERDRKQLERILRSRNAKVLLKL